MFGWLAKEEEIIHPDPINGHEMAYALNFIGFLLIHAYFALRLADGGVTCLVSDEIDTPIKESKVDSTHPADDISAKFAFGHAMLFVTLAVLWAGLHFNHKYLREENKRVTIYYGVVWPSAIWVPVCWMVLFVIRFSHGGEVCSGDELGADHGTKGYLIEQDSSSSFSGD